MGNYRFKLSDMIPNAWFYKLKDMGKGRTNTNNNKKTTTFSKKKSQTSSSSTTTTTTNTTQSPKPKQPHQNQNPRKSYYFTRELINNNNNSPPRKSSPKQQKRVTRRRKRRTTTTTPPRASISSPKLATTTSSSVVSAGCSCRTTLESVWTKSADSPPESSSSSSSSPPFDDDSDDFPEQKLRTDCVLPTESSSSMFDEMVSLSTNTDTVIDVDKNSLARKDDKLDDGYDGSFSDLDLPPIITKPNKAIEEEPKRAKGSLRKVKIVNVKEQNHHHNTNSSVRGFSVNSPGLKLRINSPRLGRKALQAHGGGGGGRRSVSSASSGRSLSGSFAVVKSSMDPQKDFRESMVEMIVENNIKASKDLEDLLACYLSLNSDEYHQVIINVFKQIWFDLTLQTR